MKRVSNARGMRLVSRKLMSSCCTNRAIRDRAVISVSFACNTVRASRQPEDTAINTIILYVLGAVALAIILQKIRTAAAALARQAPLAQRALAHGAALRVAGTVLRVRRVALLQSRRVARERRRGAARRLHAARGRVRRALQKDGGAHRRNRRQRLRSAVHFPLPRAVSIQRLRAAALQVRQLRAILVRRAPSPISTAIGSTT